MPNVIPLAIRVKTSAARWKRNKQWRIRTKEQHYCSEGARYSKPKNGGWLVKFEDPITIFTAILAVSTIVLTIVSALQWRALESTDKAVHKSADAAIDSAKAALLQATQNRARLWIAVNDRPFPPASPDDPSEAESGFVRIALKFSLFNYGATPAILTSSVFHLFWWPDEPDPIVETQDQQIHEDGVWPGDGPGVIVNNNQGLPGELIRYIPGNAQKPVSISKEFRFVKQGNGYHSMSAERKRFWFFAVIKYKDVYGIDRETCLYGNPVTGQSSERYTKDTDHRCNYFD